jgi:c-di-GMP-binding flagellar brake protein YcgR
LSWLETVGMQDKSIIDFEGTKVYSPSFLEESFGGVIREAKTKEEAEKNRQKLKNAQFVNIDPLWKEKLGNYIIKAKYNPKKSEGDK